MPAARAVAVLRATLEDAAGRVLHRNFTSFVVGEGASPRDETLARGRPQPAGAARGPRPRERRALERAPLDGDGRPQAERRGSRLLRVPAARGRRTCEREDVAGASFVAELGAKQLFGKDRADKGRVQGDFMLGARHARPRPQPERLPDDRRRDAPERRADRRERRGARELRPAGRPGRPPRPAVLARAEARRPARRGGLLRHARHGDASAPRRCARPRPRASCASGSRWTRRCPAASPSTGRRAAATRSTRASCSRSPAERRVRASAAGTSRSAGARRTRSRRRSAACRSSGTRWPRARPPSGRSRAAAPRAACPRAPSGSRRSS